ncbi:hypothetical protein LAZ40_04285 [Cereibacter sphaeroides]|uniref:hypothetical protein n=1 Tax=Cereibacter sphaeroides TaxID=1063 RepID=UPI001F26A434|nr:hypothetical protein [Cereibacter sphaeroides]MCE6958273.1 hypothetical protein [Cereibacter sphaeroides]MCE6971336.1 hypothetical protein [Cereibacter sphaeroides]
MHPSPLADPLIPVAGTVEAQPVTERGPWLATSLGGMWSILTPHARDVFIEDIAAGISRTCRYAGQVKAGVPFYSVAEHCVLMTRWALDNGMARTREEALAVLLHDASEAFYGDLPTPLKALMPEFKVIEDRAQAVIDAAFGIDRDRLGFSRSELKRLDRSIRLDERAALIREPALSAGLRLSWSDDPGLEPTNMRIDLLEPGQAERAFLDCFCWCCENLPSSGAFPHLALAQAERARAALAEPEPERLPSP